MKWLLVLVLASCADEPDLPSCKAIGCDGTQEVPLYCPGPKDDKQDQPVDGSCFCAVPDGTDAWCMP